MGTPAPMKGPPAQPVRNAREDTGVLSPSFSALAARPTSEPYVPFVPRPGPEYLDGKRLSSYAAYAPLPAQADSARDIVSGTYQSDYDVARACAFGLPHCGYRRGPVLYNGMVFQDSYDGMPRATSRTDLALIARATGALGQRERVWGSSRFH